MNNQMFHQSPNQDMNMLTSQMNSMSVNTDESKDVPFDPNPVSSADIINEIGRPETQEDWEKIGKIEELLPQKNMIEKYKDDFRNLPEDFQMQMLGDLIYSTLNDHNLGEEEQKQITGMINDYEVLSLEEILELLSNPDVLKERINEALDLIHNGDEEEEEEGEEGEEDQED